jgi:hypothetical protein
MHYVQQQGQFVPRSNLAVLADESVAKCLLVIAVARQLNPEVTFAIENPIYRSFKQLPGIKGLIDDGCVNYLHLNDYDDDFYSAL